MMSSKMFSEKIDAPEPPPRRSGVVVFDLLRERLRHYVEGEIITATESEYIGNLISDREDFGVKKYGQPLMTDDGRRTSVDCLQEAVDMLIYLEKAAYNGELGEFSDMIESILRVCQKIIGE